MVCRREWQHLTRTRMKSWNITSLQQKPYTCTKTIYTKDAGWVYFMIHLDTAWIHEPKREIRFKNTRKINLELK